MIQPRLTGPQLAQLRRVLAQQMAQNAAPQAQAPPDVDEENAFALESTPTDQMGPVNIDLSKARTMTAPPAMQLPPPTAAQPDLAHALKETLRAGYRVLPTGAQQVVTGVGRQVRDIVDPAMSMAAGVPGAVENLAGAVTDVTRNFLNPETREATQRGFREGARTSIGELIGVGQAAAQGTSGVGHQFMNDPAEALRSGARSVVGLTTGLDINTMADEPVMTRTGRGLVALGGIPFRFSSRILSALNRLSEAPQHLRKIEGILRPVLSPEMQAGFNELVAANKGKLFTRGQMEQWLATSAQAAPEAAQLPQRGAEQITKLGERLGAPDGGFTVHAVTGQEPVTGFAVSVAPEQTVSVPSSATRADLLRSLGKFYRDNEKLLASPNHYLGGWHDPNTNELIFDISQVVPTQAEAEAIGRAKGQKAIFDFAHGKSLPVSQSGTTLRSEPFGAQATAQLVREHPQIALSATGAAVGASAGADIDQEHPVRGALAGAAVGALAGRGLATTVGEAQGRLGRYQSMRVVDKKLAEAATNFPTDLGEQWGSVNLLMTDWMSLQDSPEYHRISERLKSLMSQMHAQHLAQRIASGESQPGVYDVVILGGGPGGMHASITASGDGLSNHLIDMADEPGGAAAFSSRIENTGGFVAGISGDDFGKMMWEQAQRLGAEGTFGVEALDIVHDPATGLYKIPLSNGKTLTAKSVVLGVGNKFKPLLRNGVPVPGTEAAIPPRLFKKTVATEGVGKRVVVFGGGNNSGQAVLNATRTADHVTLIARSDLGSSMSDYLIKGLRALQAEGKVTIMAGAGDELERIVLGPRGQAVRIETTTGQHIPADMVGIFIGTEPNTDWLPAAIKRDGRGFIQVDPDTLETSMPGVFAVGDARVGSEGKIASAMADGQRAMSHAFQHSRPKKARAITPAAAP